MHDLVWLLYNKARYYKAGREGKVPYYSSTILLLSPFPISVSDYKKDYDKLLLGMNKQQQTLQTQREPEVETEIECPRYDDTMALSSDFDKLFYFCEECNMSLSIK